MTQEHPAKPFTIRIEELELWANIGVTSAERSWPQRLLITVQIPAPAPTDDELGSALDYAAVVETIRSSVAAREFRLLETLANTIAANIFSAHRVEPDAVSIKKFVIPGCKAIVVTRHKTR